MYRGKLNFKRDEKGVDVKIAIDLIADAYEARFDTAIIFSQDHDFAPAVELAAKILQVQKRQSMIFSAYPFQKGAVGIPGTLKFVISRRDYFSCLDSKDYR